VTGVDWLDSLIKGAAGLGAAALLLVLARRRFKVGGDSGASPRDDLD
jgi:hypothetical protein